MGGYKLSLHGSLPPDGRDGSSRCVQGEKQRDFQKGGHHHDFLQSKRVQSVRSPPRRSTGCCDGLTERREFERRLSAIVPLQDFQCMGHSFRSEDNNDSLALWEEAEYPASLIDQGWAELTRPSPRWLEAMRKFDTTKLAPWRSSPVHPKASSDGRRLSLSDRKGSMKSFHQSAKAPWYSNATAKMGKGECRSVRSPRCACNLSVQSGELISWSGSLLISPAQSGELQRSEFSIYGNFPKKSDKLFVFEEATFGNISAKLEHAEGECLASGVRSEIPAEDSNMVQTEGALEDGSHTASALQFETTAKNTDEAPTHPKSTSRDFSSAKAMDSSTCEADALSAKTTAVQENQDEPSALTPINGNALCSFKQRNEEAGGNSETLVTAQRCLRLAIPSSEQDDDTSPYEALRKRYILKAESEPLDGSLYVFQLKMPAQSVINKEEEAGMSLQSCLLNSRSSGDGGEGHPNQVQASSTSDRMFVSLQNKGSQGMKKKLGEFLESSSPRSILCGLADEGSLPSSNPSLRSSTSSALPNSASESYSSSDASLDLKEHDFEASRSADNLIALNKLVESRHVILSFRDSGPSRPSLENAASATAAVKKVNLNTELLGCEDDGELRSSSDRKSTTELWTAKFPTLLQESSSQVDTPTELESAFPPRNDQPATDVKQSESEDSQMSSVVLTSRPRHNGSTTARLGGMFSPLRLTSKCEDGVASNYRNCFVASRTLSFSPHDNNLAVGNRSPTYDSTLELLTMEFQERKSKSKWHFSNRRHSSADSSDAPTMMISINNAMKKIMSKCTAKRSKPPTARGS